MNPFSQAGSTAAASQAAAQTDWPWENKARAGKAEDVVCADCGTLDVCRHHEYRRLCVVGQRGNKEADAADVGRPRALSLRRLRPQVQARDTAGRLVLKEQPLQRTPHPPCVS